MKLFVFILLSRINLEARFLPGGNHLTSFARFYILESLHSGPLFLTSVYLPVPGTKAGTRVSASGAQQSRTNKKKPSPLMKAETVTSGTGTPVLVVTKTTLKSTTARGTSAAQTGSSAEMGPHTSIAMTATSPRRPAETTALSPPATSSLATQVVMSKGKKRKSFQETAKPAVDQTKKKKKKDKSKLMRMSSDEEGTGLEDTEEAAALLSPPPDIEDLLEQRVQAEIQALPQMEDESEPEEENIKHQGAAAEDGEER